MRKVWIYKRENIKGWWVGWYEISKRKTKALPSKALAEHFRRIKYAQLNSDVFTGIVTIDWEQMRNEYQHSKKVAGNQDVSIYEAGLFTTDKMMQLQQIAYRKANSNRTIPTVLARKNSTDYHKETQPRILVDTNDVKGCSVHYVF